MDTATLFEARAKVLHDLEARRLATAETVSTLEEAMSERAWWAEQWPEGLVYVAGLVAQDVQDALFDGAVSGGSQRWPVCTSCPPHAPLHSLSISPDLGGPDPVWVCEESGDVVAPLGGLAAGPATEPDELS
ncbi:hypothetical protein [Nocardioides sp. KR10-350]|uniref:hypothetical protein n=1 Tax=Nocardioides cheoyonin TaxID=3156615 RepID=UPI0032B31F83